MRSKVATRIALVLLPMLLSGCSTTTILEQGMVMRYHCAVSSDGAFVTLSGYSYGGALLVRKVKTLRQGQDLLVSVHISPIGGESAAFVERVPIDAGLSRILFGTERVVVWSRDEKGCVY